MNTLRPGSGPTLEERSVALLISMGRHRADQHSDRLAGTPSLVARPSSCRDLTDVEVITAVSKVWNEYRRGRKKRMFRNLTRVTVLLACGFLASSVIRIVDPETRDRVTYRQPVESTRSSPIERETHEVLNQSVVTSGDGDPKNIRERPSNGMNIPRLSRMLGTEPEQVSCYTYGEEVRGRGSATSSVWYRLDQGGWVSALVVNLWNGSGLERCASTYGARVWTLSPAPSSFEPRSTGSVQAPSSIGSRGQVPEQEKGSRRWSIVYAPGGSKRYEYMDAGDLVKMPRSSPGSTSGGRWQAANAATVLAGIAEGRNGLISYLASDDELRSQVEYVVMFDPGSYNALKNDAEKINTASVLKAWLDSNPDAHLVVFVGTETEDKKNPGSLDSLHQGLRQFWFSQIAGTQASERVTVCDIGGKSDEFKPYMQWIQVRQTTCPSGVVAWHP